MKTTPLENLQSTLARHTALVIEVDLLKKQSAETCVQRDTIESSCDLADNKALAEITRLQVVASLLPRRIANRDAETSKAETALLESAHTFVQEAFGPAVSEMQARALDKAKASLEPHFPHPANLEKAIFISSMVREWDLLAHIATVEHEPTGGLLVYVKRLLDGWEQFQSLKAKF